MEEQLEVMQNQIRQLRKAVSILALLVLFLVILNLARNPAGQLSSLQLDSLDIVNAEGTAVIHLGPDSSGSGDLWLVDESGKVIRVGVPPKNELNRQDAKTAKKR